MNNGKGIFLDTSEKVQYTLTRQGVSRDRGHLWLDFIREPTLTYTKMRGQSVEEWSWHEQVPTEDDINLGIKDLFSGNQSNIGMEPVVSHRLLFSDFTEPHKGRFRRLDMEGRP